MFAFASESVTTSSLAASTSLSGICGLRQITTIDARHSVFAVRAALRGKTPIRPFSVRLCFGVLCGGPARASERHAVATLIFAFLPDAAVNRDGQSEAKFL